MDNIFSYFLRSLAKSARNYIRFYILIVARFWDLPRTFDLRDGTLTIRAIKYFITTIAISGSAMYMLMLLWPQWKALVGDTPFASLYNISGTTSLIIGFVHLFVVAGVTYIAAQIAISPKTIWFRECVVLLIILGMIFTPFNFFLFVILPLYLAAEMTLESYLIVFQMPISILMLVVSIRNISLLLDTGIKGTIGIGVFLIVASNVIQRVVVAIYQSVSDIPENVKRIWATLVAALGHWF